jgi:hypothetical protein
MMKPLSIIAAGAVIPGRDASWHGEVPARLLRRDPRIWHMAYVAVARLLKTTDRRPRSVMAGTALGALDETRKFLDGIFAEGFGSPRHFIASVHNSMAGKLAVEFSIHGPNLTFCDGHNSLASAINACSVCTGGDFPSLVVAVDESIPLLSGIVPHCAPGCREFLADHHEEGAVALLLDNSDCAAGSAPRIRAFGPLVAADKGSFDLSTALFEQSAPDAQVIEPAKNRSFIAAALRVFDCIQKGGSGKTIVGSYSPSSRAFAAIEVAL